MKLNLVKPRKALNKTFLKVKHKYLQKVFYAVPKMIGRKFKYSHADSSMQSRDLKEAYRDFHLVPSLFYWAREARNSNAEIDYIIPCCLFANYFFTILCDKKDTNPSSQVHPKAIEVMREFNIDISSGFPISGESGMR